MRFEPSEFEKYFILTLAGIIGWSLITIIDLLPILPEIWVANMLGYNWTYPTSAWRLLPFYAVFGLPIALAASWFFGGLIWQTFGNGKTIQPQLFLLMGILSAAIIRLTGITLGLIFLGFRGNGSGWTKQYGYKVSENGARTAFGWLLEIPDFIMTCLAGGLTGIIVFILLYLYIRGMVEPKAPG